MYKSAAPPFGGASILRLPTGIPVIIIPIGRFFVTPTATITVQPTTATSGAVHRVITPAAAPAGAAGTIVGFFFVWYLTHAIVESSAFVAT